MKKTVVTLLAAALLIGSCLTANAAGLKDVFNAKYYADQYPDLKAAFGYDEEMLYQHFLDYGLKEGRNMSPVLDVRAYRERYADLDAAFGDNWDAYVQHFFDYGIKENRETGTNFDVKTYIEAYGDIKAAFGEDYVAAIDHYLTYGIAENRVLGNTDVYVAQNSPSTGTQPEGGTGDTTPDEGGSDVSGGDANPDGDDTTPDEGDGDVSGGDVNPGGDETTPGEDDTTPDGDDTETGRTETIYNTNGSYIVNYYNTEDEIICYECYTAEDVLWLKVNLERALITESWGYDEEGEVTSYTTYTYDSKNRTSTSTTTRYADGVVTKEILRSREYLDDSQFNYTENEESYNASNELIGTAVTVVESGKTVQVSWAEKVSKGWYAEDNYYNSDERLYKEIIYHTDGTKTMYEYDMKTVLNNVVYKFTSYAVDGSISKWTEYEYDYEENAVIKRKEIYYSAELADFSSKYVYEYREDGETLLKETIYDEEGLLWSFTDYDEEGIPTTRTSYTYEEGEISGWSISIIAEDPVFAAKTTWYDAEGVITSVYEYAENSSTIVKYIWYYEGEIAWWETYAYDENGNRITTKYDADGNITSVTEAAENSTKITSYSDGVITGWLIFTYGENGSYIKTIYDADGNITGQYEETIIGYEG